MKPYTPLEKTILILYAIVALTSLALFIYSLLKY